MDKCSICGYKGKDEHDDIYDCQSHLEEKNGIRKGQWMIDWMRRLKEKESNEPYVSDFVKWSKGFSIIILLLFSGCVQVLEYEEDSEPTYIFTIQPRLPQDLNGYYHLTMNRNTWGTTHRISGNVYDENGFPVEMYWVEWESNLYWYLGDTLGYIINRNLNSGIYIYTDTSYVIGFSGMEVPTSNQISYSNSNGEINNMIRPIKTMIGDTMTLSYYYYNGSGSIDIVLD